MTQKLILTGTADTGNGDPIRTAFTKVNENFTELYTALGLDGGGLNLGAFEFTGSVMTTTDSTAIVIDQATTVTSNLSVGGDILPQTANGGDLGSSTLPWRSLYVSNNTIFIGNTSVGVDANGNLTTNGSRVGAFSFSVAADDSTQRLISSGELVKFIGAGGITTSSDAEGYITITGSGGSIGNISNGTGPTTDPNSLVSSASAAFINFASDLDGAFGLGTNDGSLVKITTDGGASAFEFTADNGAGSIKFPDGTIQTTAAQAFSFSVAADDSTQRLISSGELVKFIGAGGVTTASDAEGNITINYVQGDIRSEGNINIDINLSDSTLRRWQFGEDGDTVFPNNVSINYSGGNIQFPRIIADSGKAFSIQGQGNSGSTALSWTVDPDAASQYAAVSVSRAGGDNLAKVVLQAQSDSGDGATVKLWKFDETGALTIPGDIRSEGSINIDINLSDSTLRRWQFGEDGLLTFPDGTNQSTAWTGSTTVSSLVNGANTLGLGSTGILTLPEGSTIDESLEIVTVTLDQFTDGGFPGTRVFTKTSDTLYELSPGGPYMTLISGIWRLKVSTATYYDSTDLITWGTVAGGLPTPVGTLTTVVTTNLTVGGDVWGFDGNGALTFPDATTQTTAYTGIPGPYADDEAAALAGVALGSPYHKTGTGGQVFVRLTSPT